MFKYYLFLAILLIASVIQAQNDTIITKDNTVLVGEIDEMTKGVLTFETSYSDKDFKIEWLNVKHVTSAKNYRIILTNGTRLRGTISSVGPNSIVVINDQKQGLVKVKISYIVYLRKVDSENILDAISLSLDIGYSYTKSTKLHQLNSDIKAIYYSNVWGANLFLNTVQNIQDNREPTKRTNAGLGLKYFFIKNYFGGIDADYFSNNEQNLNLRSNYNISVGKFFANTNQLNFNSSIGVAYSFENYADTIHDRRSIEGKLGLFLNLFDVGDLNFISDINFYPSITERYRLRTTMSITMKYDLPRDFYLKLGLDYDYDTKPIEGIDPEDYVVTFGVGWEL